MKERAGIPPETAWSAAPIGQLPPALPSDSPSPILAPIERMALDPSR